mmetsp:Transcript_290/g.784  ORF Transcript_290/g.784 Transcript_290/m.784 type:complete len:393 (-) Transcript_290:889-2067(-)
MKLAKKILKYRERKNTFLKNEIELILAFYQKNFPRNYNFEIKKTINKLEKNRFKTIFLQLPEGLFCFSIFLIDLFVKNLFFSKIFYFSNRTIFGACCVDDNFVKFVGLDVILHYGHSCLIPVFKCIVSISYIFLEIFFDNSVMIESFIEKFYKKNNYWGLTSTIQFTSSLRKINLDLSRILGKIIIPQNKPLSPGELLGCTGFFLKNCKNIIYIGDGKFHLESAIMTNPISRFFQYNPFSHSLFIVEFSFLDFLRKREFFLNNSFFKKKNSGIIISSLGRQGNTKILRRFKELLKLKKISAFIISMSEISFDRLDLIGKNKINAWNQIACPRLSSDWSDSYKHPLLSTHEFGVVLNVTDWEKFFFKMDFYSQKGGFWANYYDSKSNFYIKNI